MRLKNGESTRAGLSSKNEQSFSNVVPENFLSNDHTIKLEFFKAQLF